MKHRTSPRHGAVALLLAIAASIYWLALSGPLLLDDHTTLAGVQQWLVGTRSWLSTIFPNSESVIFSRPVAMASFMASAWLGDGSVFAYKLGNLILHLLCGILALVLIRRLLRLDVRLADHYRSLAVFILAIWLLHPMHVSTVLYVVQRMAQLATLFTLAALIVYLIGRQQLSEGNSRMAALNLFIGVPLLTILGLLSKQNAAAIPLLCLVLELAYFSGRRHVAVYAFFAALLILPGAAATGLLIVSPDVFLAGYADWDFTLTQRLLTQPRVIFDYIAMWVAPRSPAMGLYTDGYVVSKSLISPATTAPALLGLIAISAIAALKRKSHPTVFAGWFLFLGAHVVESTFLPLEMYYEHRNYLPSIGVLLALTGVIGGYASNSRRIVGRRAILFATSATVAALSFATFGRVLVWQNEATIVAQAIRYHPESTRLRLDSLRLQLSEGAFAKAYEEADLLTQGVSSDLRVSGYTHLFAIDCLYHQRVDPSLLHRAVEESDNILSSHDMHSLQVLLSIDSAEACPAWDQGQIADAIVQVLERAPYQSEKSGFKSTVRIMAIRFYARADRWDLAEDQARILWEGNGFLPSAGWLVRTLIHNKKFNEAEEILDVLRTSVKTRDSSGLEEVHNLEQMLANTVHVSRTPGTRQ